MKQEITKGLADGTVTLAVSGGIATKLGWFEFINANAPALGWMTSVFFGLVALLFYYLTWKKNGIPENNAKKIDENVGMLVAHIEETKNGFDKSEECFNLLSGELKEISNKIDKQSKE